MPLLAIISAVSAFIDYIAFTLHWRGFYQSHTQRHTIGHKKPDCLIWLHAWYFSFIEPMPTVLFHEAAAMLSFLRLLQQCRFSSLILLIFLQPLHDVFRWYTSRLFVVWFLQISTPLRFRVFAFFAMKIFVMLRLSAAAFARLLSPPMLLLSLINWVYASLPLLLRFLFDVTLNIFYMFDIFHWGKAFFFCAFRRSCALFSSAFAMSHVRGMYFLSV